MTTKRILLAILVAVATLCAPSALGQYVTADEGMVINAMLTNKA